MRNRATLLPILAAWLGCLHLLTALEVQFTHLESGQTDSRPARMPFLLVEAGKPVSPFLPEGQFRAEWTNEFSLPKRSYLYFQIVGSAQNVELKIDDEAVCAALDEKSGRLRLSPGDHVFTLKAESSPEGAMELRVNWEGRDFAPEPIPPSLFADPDTPANFFAEPKTASARHGRELFATQHCNRCHLTTGNPQMPELIGHEAPSLVGVENRLTNAWLAQWIANPKSLKPTTNMPHAGDPEQAKHIAAWLVRDALDAAPVPTAGNAENGGKVFETVGCAACHHFETPESSDLRQISLQMVGPKYRHGQIAAKILDPAQHYAGSKMPKFRVSETEAADLEAYLRGKSAKWDAPNLSGTDPALGRQAFSDASCSACHQAKDATPPRAFATWDGIDMTKFAAAHLGEESKLAPRYELSEIEVESIAKFAAHPEGVASLGRKVDAEAFHRKIRTENCQACHAIDAESAYGWKADGPSPPMLTFAGEKLRTDWLKAFLVGDLDQRPRPWLKIQMPMFPRDAEILAVGAAHHHGLAEA